DVLRTLKRSPRRRSETASRDWATPTSRIQSRGGRGMPRPYLNVRQLERYCGVFRGGRVIVRLCRFCPLCPQSPVSREDCNECNAFSMQHSGNPRWPPTDRGSRVQKVQSECCCSCRLGDP